jgi:hypothetical protein
VTLAVVTWNLHDGTGDLPRLLDDLRSGRLTGAPVGDYVVLLQEAVVRAAPETPSVMPTLEAGDIAVRGRGVQADQPRGARSRQGDQRQPDLDDLARQRGLHVFHVPVFAGGPRPRGTAIVSTLPLFDARAIELPEERQHRVAASAGVTVAGERLFIVSAHLENRLPLFRGGPFGDRARGRQAVALVQALPAPGHGIVGGDLNTMLGASEPAQRILTDRFPDTPAARRQPTFRDRLVLDHLFFDVPTGWTVARLVVADRYDSDHHPVVGLVGVSGADGRSAGG